MSAFIHSPEHVISIVASAARLNLGPLKVGRWVYSLHIPYDCDALCRLLYMANVQSVNYRYTERNRLAMPGRYHTGGLYSVLNAAALCKAIDSLEYQSNEHPSWSASPACKLLTQLRELASRKAYLRAQTNAYRTTTDVSDFPAYKSADVWSITQ